eukprot:12406341-Karenia_brevis.AAC.1
MLIHLLVPACHFFWLPPSSIGEAAALGAKHARTALHQCHASPLLWSWSACERDCTMSNPAHPQHPEPMTVVHRALANLTSRLSNNDKSTHGDPDAVGSFDVVCAISGTVWPGWGRCGDRAQVVSRAPLHNAFLYAHLAVPIRYVASM